MGDTPVVIPERAFFKSSEVCEIADVQAYVLKTWELEFASLGVPRPGGGRVYRRQDVERVLEIKHLVFSEGLTLAGARRRLEGDAPPPPDALPIETFVAPEVRQRLNTVKEGLRSILTLLKPGDSEKVEAPAAAEEAPQAVPGDDLFSAVEPDGPAAKPRLKVARPAKARVKPKKGTRQAKPGRR